MYLKSIKSQGFKSFASEITLNMGLGITAVVGPNGSGKSNIVDAVRWVLGEQSIKALRGNSSMSDVIFSGSKTRTPMNRAFVSLTFDNEDHYLNSDFKELEIKRVVYRSGENEYYINNTKVRLKDITDLFMDSGASKESFNIISQGSVTDVINEKPIDRRVIFEDAAGVLKYKKRKEETLRKLAATKDNISKVDLVINELSISLNPLKEQSDIAKKYVLCKDKLSALELSLTAYDISSIYEEYQKIESIVKTKTEEMTLVDAVNGTDNKEIEHAKLELLKLEEKINKSNSSLISLNNEIASLTSEKKVSTEREKYAASSIKRKSNLVNLKEDELRYKKNNEVLKNEITSLEEKQNATNNELSVIRMDLNTNNTILKSKADKLNENNNLLLVNTNKMHILENNIDNNENVPYAVKSILNNPRLKGIHNTVGSLIDVKSEYTEAINTSLGANANVIVVDNEESAKEAINYLKDNKLGRASFFPINIIKPRFIPLEVLKRLDSVSGFIGVASSLVSSSLEYKDIIENQLGNTLVVSNIDALNMIGRIIEYKYRIVSLDGDVLYAGGMIAGGTSKNKNSILNDKVELEKIKKIIMELNNDITDLTKEINAKNADIDIIKDREEAITRKYISISEDLSSKKNLYNEFMEKLESISLEIKGTKDIDNDNLSDSLIKLMENINKKETERDLLNVSIKELKDKKDSLNENINKKEHEFKEAFSKINKIQKEISDNEIKLGKMDVRLDSLLLLLNETYNITYEKAKLDYPLEYDYDEAKKTLANLKNEMKSYGEVNVGSIKEFERINERYTFLTNQKDELNSSIESLLNIIYEMDEIMKTKFKETFNKIEKEFSLTFKSLFKGGTGLLKLTDPDNLLETGIEIIAEPPGKKLSSIVLLSGGEKTLTAIALLFAILNVKTVPFCILDEVEAALDDANVSTFGNYLESKKDTNQFIIITHKKKTMEYADVLYGITMQESGVSKLVSVKLEEN